MKTFSPETPIAGVVSIDDHYTDGNVHLISNYWGLNSFLEAPGLPDRELDVTFISTASKPYETYNEPARFLGAERAWLNEQQGKGRLRFTEFCIVGKEPGEIYEELEDKDAIMMGGGNTQFLLDQLHTTGADDVIRGLVSDGTWYLGKSAGAIVAGPDIDPRGFFMPAMMEHSLDDTTGMGLTEVFPLPHIDTPSIMEKVYDGKTGWQHAIEMTRVVPTAYILDNAHKTKA